ASSESPSYAESEYPSVAGWPTAAALVRGSWKLLMTERAQLFDLAADPDEQRDLAPAQPARAREMTAALQVIRRRVAETTAAPAAATTDTAQRLRALGYVAAPTARAATATAMPATALRDWSIFEAALTDSRTGRVARALPVFASLAAAYPDAPIFASTYARALADTGAIRQALTQLRAAVARWPSDWSLFHELSATARAAGLAAEARRAEEAALALNPHEPSALNGKGLLLADAGAPAEAAQAFALAVEYDPTSGPYHANLGNARRALGDLDGAAAAYREALARVPDLADAANGLGVVLVQQQRAAEALPFLERAARDAGFLEAQLNLGIALQQAGETDRAVAQYRKLAALAAPSRERAAARALLGELGRK
ncbi:MAG: tetratricopeptide repeat protein, partial [Acidobacteriota bacterium]